MSTYWLTRTAMFLALTVLCQSLRVMLPLPPTFSFFVIGSLVNACLLTTARMLGITSALIICCIAPVIAYFQHMLPVPLLIIPVAAGNALMVFIYLSYNSTRIWSAISLAALGKMILLYTSVLWLLTNFIKLPSRAAELVIFVMGWPQLVTVITGGFLAQLVVVRLARRNITK